MKVTQPVHSEEFSDKMTQYVVWTGLTFKTSDIKDINKFMKDNNWGSLTYKYKWKTLPGFGGMGGRTDVLFLWKGNIFMERTKLATVEKKCFFCKAKIVPGMPVRFVRTLKVNPYSGPSWTSGWVHRECFLKEKGEKS